MRWKSPPISSPPGPGGAGARCSAERLAPDDALLDKAAALIAGARRPLLWLGGGCVTADAAAEVRELAAKLGAPVVSSLNGRGVVATDDPLFVGSQTHYPAFRELIGQSDLVLAIGTRFQAVATWFWSIPMPPRLIHIDADVTMLGRNYPAEIGITGDARLAAAGLARRIGDGIVDSQYLALAARVREELAEDTLRRIGPDHQQICDAIDRLAPADRNVVCDATMAGTTWAICACRFASRASSLMPPAWPSGRRCRWRWARRSVRTAALSRSMAMAG